MVGLYLLLMVSIGYFFMKREAASSTDAYFRGGKRIPWWVAGLSIFATMLSAITFMAIPAKAYAGNMNSWIGMWPMALIIPLVVYCYLPFFRKLNVTSAYEFLEQRFNLASRLIASLVHAFSRRAGRDRSLPACLGFVQRDGYRYLPGDSFHWDSLHRVYRNGRIGGGGLDGCDPGNRIARGSPALHPRDRFPNGGGLGEIIEVTQSDSKLLTADWGTLDFGSSTNSAWVILLGFAFASLPSYTAGQDVVQRYVSPPRKKKRLGPSG